MDNLDGGYTDFAAAFGDETKYDDALSIEFHDVGEYDKTATEGWFEESPTNPDKAVFKKGTLTQMFWNKGETFPRSKKQGERPVFVKKLYVRIAVPGDKFSVVDKEASDIYK